MDPNTTTEQEPSPAPAGSDERLADRWTEEQKERARAIANDVAEDIDNGETREQLREALSIYADYLWDSHQARQDSLLDKTLAALEKLVALKSQNRPS